MEEYVPTCLRKDEPNMRREVMYGIAQECNNGSVYDFWVEPVCFEETVLETVGRDNNSVIIRFNMDDVDRMIWRWHDDRWRKIEEVEISAKELVKREVIYAIGQDGGEGRYDFWDGPNPSEEKMLEVAGRDSNSIIIRFNADGSEDVIWQWDNDRWRRERNPSKN